MAELLKNEWKETARLYIKIGGHFDTVDGTVHSPAPSSAPALDADNCRVGEFCYAKEQTYARSTMLGVTEVPCGIKFGYTTMRFKVMLPASE